MRALDALTLLVDVVGESEERVRGGRFLIGLFFLDSLLWGVGKIAALEILETIEGRRFPICYIVASLMITATEIIVEFVASALTPAAFGAWCRATTTSGAVADAQSSRTLALFAAQTYRVSRCARSGGAETGNCWPPTRSVFCCARQRWRRRRRAPPFARAWRGSRGRHPHACLSPSSPSSATSPLACSAFLSVSLRRSFSRSVELARAGPLPGARHAPAFFYRRRGRRAHGVRVRAARPVRHAESGLVRPSPPPPLRRPHASGQPTALRRRPAASAHARLAVRDASSSSRPT